MLILNKETINNKEPVDIFFSDATTNKYIDYFWKILEQVLAIRDDYDIYMRHYTEGTNETVIFFIPNKY